MGETMCAKQVNKKYKNKKRRRNQYHKISQAVQKQKVPPIEAKSAAQEDEQILETTDLAANDVTGEEGADPEPIVEEQVESAAEAVEVESLAPESQEQPTSKESPVAGKTKVDIEIDQPKQRRHKSWMWFAILAVLVAAGVALALILVGQRPQDSEPIPDISMTDNNEDDETKDAEESPQDEENTDDPSKNDPEPPAQEEKPPVQEEAPKPQPVDPIVERPGQNTEVPQVAPGSKVIALTFDDGPSTVTTPRLLDILGARNTKATFFVLGNMALRSPDLVRREEAEGHEVASHTPYHNQLTQLSFAQIRAEAVEMDRIFNEILGHVPPFTRPPYGSYNAMVGEALAQPMILWSIDPRDWADRNASIVCSRVTSAAFDGAVILVHDIHATTVDAVPCIIDTLRAQGYEFLTVSELAAARGVTMVNGGVYGSFR